MLGVLAKRLLPGIKISSYTARHARATLAYHMGMPVGIICQAVNAANFPLHPSLPASVGIAAVSVWLM
jgi:hypothetical protein